MSTRNPMYQAVISSCEGRKGDNIRGGPRGRGMGKWVTLCPPGRGGQVGGSHNDLREVFWRGEKVPLLSELPDRGSARFPSPAPPFKETLPGLPAFPPSGRGEALTKTQGTPPTPPLTFQVPHSDLSPQPPHTPNI